MEGAGQSEYIRALLELQSAIQEHQSITYEGSSLSKTTLAVQKRNELRDSLNKVTTEYIVAKISELNLREWAKFLYCGKGTPKDRRLCKSETLFLGESYTSLLRVLLILRDSKIIFKFFSEQINKDQELDESFLDFLADDIVFFLFADFASSEKSIVHCLRLLKSLIKVGFRYNTAYRACLASGKRKTKMRHFRARCL